MNGCRLWAVAIEIDLLKVQKFNFMFYFPRLNLTCAREGQQLVPKVSILKSWSTFSFQYNLFAIDLYLGLNTPRMEKNYVNPNLYRSILNPAEIDV